MKRWIKGSLYTIEPYISLYVFLFVLFVIGVIFGANLVGNLNFLQQQDLLFFVENYFQMLERPADQAIMDSFLNILYTHGKYMIFLFLFGLSFVGLPIVWFLLFLKGVVVGFTVGFLVHQLAWDGFYLTRFDRSTKFVDHPSLSILGCRKYDFQYPCDALII